MKHNNPIIPGRGVCDPHIHIFQDRAYLYASHDLSVENDTWLMSDWQIWSSENLTEWKYESSFRPEDTYIGASRRCWAVDAAEKNGRFYYYFSNANIDTGAAVSDSPAGGWRDALGEPLLAENLTPSKQYDPTAFMDDDGTPYILWGLPDGDGYYISRLNDDMLSLAEPPRRILIDGGPARDDKNFLHRKNGVYYLSWGSNYATADNVYGPYTYRGTLGISEDHGSFFSWNGQDFYAFTIFDPTKYFRSTGICYIHYRQNGEMCADGLIAEYGVGIYDADWVKINAAWFMIGENIRKKENVWGGFDVGDITGDSRLFYPNIQNISGKRKLYFEAASRNESASCIEIYCADDNRCIGKCEVRPTSGYHHCGYEVFGCDINVPEHTESLRMELRFSGEGEELMRLHWFKFL